MRILYLTPGNPYIKTPETGFAEQLAKRGHTVILAYGYSPDLLKQKVDIVFGAMEYSMNLANWLGKKLNVPVYNHMEWIPPWRVGLEDPKEWGYDGTTAEKMNHGIQSQFIPMYIQQIQDWENATIRSLPGQSFKKYMKPFATNPLEAESKFYSADFDKLNHYKGDYEEKNQIMCTARLVPHKRVHHIIKALANVKNAPALKVIGYGNEMGQLKALAYEKGVNVEFLGPGQDGIKEKTIQESMFSVNIWAAIPVAESFYYKKPAISYNEDGMVELFDDTLLYANRNDIKSLSEQIQYFIDNPKERKKYGLNANKKMLSNNINMNTPDKLIKDIEKILNKGVEKWEN